MGREVKNADGQMIVDFGKRLEMAVKNIYFKKRKEHKVT